MKPFTNLNQQLTILEDRGLNFKDKHRAIKTLSRINYYNLINGYKDYFLNASTLDNNNEKFRENVFFEDIYALYSFDYELRNILLKYLLRFETNLKSKVSYRFSEVQSEPYAYLEPESFDVNSENARKIPALISAMKSIIREKESKKTSIRHYSQHHSQVPLWVLSPYFTFGNIQYFYICLKPSIKNAIAKDFALEYAEEYELNNIKLMPEMLEAIIKSVNYFRNVCAHEERLYNFKLHRKARSASLSKLLGINSNFLKNGDVFVIVAFLKLVTEKKLYERLLLELEQLFERYNNEISSLSFDEIIKEMGFPEKWKELLS